MVAPVVMRSRWRQGVAHQSRTPKLLPGPLGGQEYKGGLRASGERQSRLLQVFITSVTPGYFPTVACVLKNLMEPLKFRMKLGWQNSKPYIVFY